MTTRLTVQQSRATPEDVKAAAAGGLHQVYGDDTHLYRITPSHPSSMPDWTRVPDSADPQPRWVRVNDECPGAFATTLATGSASVSVNLLATPVALGVTELSLDLPPAPHFEALIFDVDGTLVDSLKAYFTLAERAAAHHGIAVQWPVIKNALNQNTLNFWQLIVPEQHPQRDRVIKDMAQRARDAWPQVLAERVRLMPSTPTLITTLASQRLHLGIVTSSGGDAMQPMHDADLVDHFTSVITRHDVERRKPDPEGILKVLEAMGVSADKAAYVGDSIMDIRAAHNAGVVAIGVLCGSGDNATLSAERPHYLFADAGELVQLLAWQRIETDGVGDNF